MPSFFPVPSLDAYSNNVLKLDSLTGPTTIGYIFGGLASNAPNTRGVTGAASIAFEHDFLPSSVTPRAGTDSLEPANRGPSQPRAHFARGKIASVSVGSDQPPKASFPIVAASSPILRRPRRSCTLIANCSSGRKENASLSFDRGLSGLRRGRCSLHPPAAPPSPTMKP